MSEVSASLLALIIGIDVYTSPSIRNLTGAVKDATAVKEYLECRLGVPSEQIQFLTNEHATRANIIKNLKNLAEKNDEIKMNSPIFIYYAGHGAKVDPPTQDKHRMEVLISHDYTEERTNVQLPENLALRSQEGVREAIPDSSAISNSRPGGIAGILDIELAVLINRIALAKGNNITVVLDCCHSASLTRGEATSRDIGRPADYSLHEAIYNTLDPKEIQDLPSITERGSVLPAQFSRVGYKSHMLLAACKSTELALESQGRGHFTRELLALFAARYNDKLTYSDIIGSLVVSLKESGQSPQCLGENHNRLIFDGSIAPLSLKKCFTVEPAKNKDGTQQLGKFHIKAGQHDGILSNEARFAIYAKDDSIKRQNVLATLVVEKVGPWTCTLAFPPNIPPSDIPVGAIAIQISGTPIKLYIHPPVELIKSAVQGHKGDIVVVEEKKDADISMRVDGGGEVEVQVLRREQAAVDLNFPPPCKKIGASAEKIVSVLMGISFFFWQLDLGTKKKTKVGKGVEVEFYELKPKEDDDGDIADDELSPLTTVGRSLLDKHNNKVDFVPKESVAYGLCLENKGKSEDNYMAENSDKKGGKIDEKFYDFHPFIYYFDLSDFSIAKYYGIARQANDAHSVEPTLPAGHALEVGYGSGGAEPFEYVVPQGQDIDVGILKIFLFTQAVDLGSGQPSPFEEARGGKPIPWSVMQQRIFQLRWGSIDVPIIQRRQ